MALNQTIAVIGAGNLGGALLSGLLEAEAVQPDRLRAADASAERLADLRKDLGLKRTTSNNREAVEGADVIVLAVKPHIVEAALADFGTDLKPNQLVISLAAAVPLSRIERGLRAGHPVVRAMPNIAMTAHASATALCANSAAGETGLHTAEAIFSTVGETVFVNEAQMHAVTGLSGSGPAYVFAVLEALTAGGVKMGLPASIAAALATQTLLGAAQMVQDSGMHPAELRDQVTTPGGTTIFGLHELERSGVRAGLISTVEAATNRSIELAKLLGGDD